MTVSLHLTNQRDSIYVALDSLSDTTTAFPLEAWGRMVNVSVTRETHHLPDLVGVALGGAFAVAVIAGVLLIATIRPSKPHLS